MLKLCGFPVSNYVNMVNLALLEKGLPFDFVLSIPDQSPEFLAKSPRGKVPCLETDQGFINEASVILEYLEESCTGKALLPTDPYRRAQARALMKEVELNIELPARSCYGEAFFGLTLPDALKARARDELVAGFAALKRHGRFSPFVAGNSFTLADIVFLYSTELGASVGKLVFGLDLLGDFPAATELLQRLGENPNVRELAARRDAALPGFIDAMRAECRARPDRLMRGISRHDDRQAPDSFRRSSRRRSQGQQLPARQQRHPSATRGAGARAQQLSEPRLPNVRAHEDPNSCADPHQLGQVMQRAGGLPGNAQGQELRQATGQFDLIDEQ
jgi:glutathione S-transferase